ncbi:MAG: hypothetical protein ABI696_08965 [Rubrivivax sp.]
MPKFHVVTQGDHLSALAEANGFADFHRILDRPENAALKALRDPHTLFPGDRVFIPDGTQRTERRATNALHTFEADVPTLLLRVKLLDLDGRPLRGVPVALTLPPAPDPSAEATDGAGVVEKQIQRSRDQRGRAVATAKVAKPAPGEAPERDITYDLVIGGLNPHLKFSGQQARLSNLGYFAGYTVRDVDAILWAAEEFLCDETKQRLQPGQRPPIKPAPGGGEQEPDPERAREPTGIDDAALRDRLRKAHGV